MNILKKDDVKKQFFELTRTQKFSTDDAIGVGKSTSVQCVFYNSDVKTAKLYVYSVYFADGTEWGDKEATKSTILKNGAIIEVAGNS